MQSLVIEASGLSKRFGAFRAVDAVSLSIPQGGIFGVLGPNGAGKTTTLRMLLGIIEPDSGTRTLLGSASPRSVAHRVGYLPEERGLYPGMTARESIAFMGALRGLPVAEGRRRADQRLDALGLGHAAPLKVRKLSKGMAQMVQVVGAMVHDPELIVLDEPFSGLDPVNQERLESLIRDQQARGATVILSTHVMGHAERLCDALTIITGGQRRFLGTVEEARAHLPLSIRYRPHAGADRTAVAGHLPDHASNRDGTWQFTLADDAVEPLLATLVAAHHGVAELSISRPGLHEAFVKIVGDNDDTRRGEAAA